MKRKIIVIISFIMFVILIMIGIFLKKNSHQELNNYLNNGSNLAFFYETESGEYVPGDSFASLSDIYSLNVSRSTCDNGLEGIEWDGKNKTLLLPTNKSNRCKLVFDINKRFTLLSYYPITGRDAQMTNLIKNGDYEDGDIGWSNSNASVTSVKFSHGKNSLQLNGGQLTPMSRQTLEQSAPTFNHTYYGRLKFLSSETFTTQDSRFEWFLGDNNGINDLVFASKNLKTKEWTLLSNIVTLVSNDYTSSTWSIRNFQVNPNETSYTDELMMIDLTVGFGENIPTKEELDSELIYFDGTVDIKSINSKKDGVFTVSNLPEVVKIECSNGGNAEVSGGTVTITGDSAQTTCYIKEPTMIEKLLQTSPGDGQLIQHTPELLNSAGDNGYRYSGNQPNNYICFGKGSEEYNNGTPGATCDVKNKYRVIGYVPVTLEDGSTTSLIKVIKAEYLTEAEFGTPAGTATVSSAYDGIKRIESSQSGIPAYKWNNVQDNNWTTSSLYTSLNSNDSNGYKNKAFGDTWLNKIENVRWNVGGASDNELTAQAMYEEEMTVQGATVDAQIGLMYAHDYGFASSSNNWQTELYNYDKNENRKNNWLFNGVYEWTISRDSSDSDFAYIVHNSGYVSSNNSDIVVNTYVAVRPVFYLKSDVNIKDSNADGSREHPFRIAI